MPTKYKTILWILLILCLQLTAIYIAHSFSYGRFGASIERPLNCMLVIWGVSLIFIFIRKRIKNKEISLGIKWYNILSGIILLILTFAFDSELENAQKETKSALQFYNRYKRKMHTIETRDKLLEYLNTKYQNHQEFTLNRIKSEGNHISLHLRYKDNSYTKADYFIREEHMYNHYINFTVNDSSLENILNHKDEILEKMSPFITNEACQKTDSLFEIKKFNPGTINYKYNNQKQLISRSFGFGFWITDDISNSILFDVVEKNQKLYLELIVRDKVGVANLYVNNQVNE